MTSASSIYDLRLADLRGKPLELDQFRDKALLIVNVASKCGFTPQYEALEHLQKHYGDRGFSVLGVPCNQFGGQEPGSADEIAEFCSTTYGVTFPMTEKVEVNGAGRHPLYDRLVDTPDAEGYTGDIRWNFEKFLVGPDGVVRRRFGTATKPDAPEVTAAIEALLD
jgi:glutathione peroxidase